MCVHACECVSVYVTVCMTVMLCAMVNFSSLYCSMGPDDDDDDFF